MLFGCVVSVVWWGWLLLFVGCWCVLFCVCVCVVSGLLFWFGLDLGVCLLGGVGYLMWGLRGLGCFGFEFGGLMFV